MPQLTPISFGLWPNTKLTLDLILNFNLEKSQILIYPKTLSCYR